MLKTTEEGRWRLAETKKRLDKWTVERYEKEHAQAEGEEHVGPQADPGADHGADPGADHVADPGAGADGEGDQREDIPFEDFQRDADADAEPREDVEMDMVMKGVSEDERKIIKAKDHEIMEIVRQLGGEDRAYRRERRKALKPMLAEMHSVPRVTAAARLLPSMGIIPGFALDLTTTDEHGVSWDFDVAERRAESRTGKAHVPDRESDVHGLLHVASPERAEQGSWRRTTGIHSSHGAFEVHVRNIRPADGVRPIFRSRTSCVRAILGRGVYPRSTTPGGSRQNYYRSMPIWTAGSER